MCSTSICKDKRIFFSSSSSFINCLISFLCWLFMRSMMVRRSITCDRSSSKGCWLWLARSFFGFASWPTWEGELGLCPVAAPPGCRADWLPPPLEDRAGAGAAGFGGNPAFRSAPWIGLGALFPASCGFGEGESCPSLPLSFSCLSSSGGGESAKSELESEEEVKI